MGSQRQILQKSQKQLIIVLISILRTALPYFFSMAWPFVIFSLFDKATWGECVDTLLLVNLTSPILSWGTQKHMLKKFDMMSERISDSWLENIHSRGILWIPFLFLMLLSPFPIIMKIGVLLMLIGKTIYETYEPLIQYKEKYVQAVVAEIIGFLTGFSFIMYLKNIVNYEWIILSMSIAETFRVITLILSIREVKFRLSSKYVNFNFFIQAYPYFMVGFANILLFVADRVFVYTNFENIIKAEYQIFMNFLIFVISIPNLLLIPFFKNYYRSQIKINQYLQISMILLGVMLTPIIIYTVSILCQYIYSIKIPFSFITVGMFYIFPTFVYSPFLKLMNKNKYLSIALVTFIAAAAVALACSYLIKLKGVEGALLGAVIGQWILMALILIVDFQNQSEKKIKFVNVK